MMRLKIRDIYPHLSELDGHSLEVAGWIHKTYPQWAGYMRVDIFHEETFLSLDVPAPAPSLYEMSHRDLCIYTQEYDLTVMFDGYHTHFGRFHRKVKDAFPSTKTFIDDIVQEKLIVVIGLNGSGACCAPDRLNEKLEEWKHKGYGRVDYVRSWRGTYNRVYKSDEK